GRGFTLHVHDIARGVTQQLNSGSFRSARPVWSPDGSAIMFETFLEDGVGNLYLLSADGGTAPERLAPSPNQQNASSWSSTGAIAFLERNARGDRDIWVKPPDGAPEPFAASTEDETDAHFSPDGRWIAYASGRPLGRDDTQVYVRAYPGGGPAIQISGANGFCPAWSPDGRRLYFQTRIDDSRLDAMMVVDIESTEPFRASRARPLIDEWPARCNSPTRDYDVLPDGAFVAPVIDGDRVDLTNAERRLRQAVDEVHVVLNFAEELRRRAAN
ncbi:MAG TPA: hypothetical protein VIV14_06925, partial [Gammaproteobacteria bacterium]